MSDLGSAYGEINLDLSGLRSGVTEGKSLFAQLQTGFTSTGQQLASTGAMLTASVTVPLLAIGGAAVKIAADYQSSMNMIQAVSGATADTMALVGIRAKELGSDLTLPGTSAADAADAMTALVKGGLSVADAMDAAKGAIQLSTVAEISNASAAGILAAALNTFGLAGGEATRISDLLAAGATASGGTVMGMADALRQGGAVANMAGLSIEQYSTAVSMMARSGIQGADAGTSIKTMLLSLLAPTDAAKDQMAALGISIYDMQGNMLPLPQLISQFSGALAGMSQSARGDAMKTIFGTDAIRAAELVLNAGVPAYDAMSASVNRAGAAGDIASAKMKGLSGAFEGLKSTIETLALAIAEPLLGPLESIVVGVTSMVASFMNVSPGVSTAIIAFLAVVAAAGPLVALMGAMSLAIGFVLSPLGAIVIAVGALAAAIASGAVQMSVFAPVMDQLTRIGGLLGQVFGQLFGAAEGWGSGLIAAFASGINMGSSFVADALSAIGDMISYWLTPGSPPPLLPNLDRWGEGAAQAYLEGWSSADPEEIQKFGDALAGMIEGFNPGAALKEIATTGSLSAATFASLTTQAGSSADEASRLLTAFVSLAAAGRDLAQSEGDVKSASQGVQSAQVAYLNALKSGDVRLIAEKRAMLEAAKARQSDARSRLSAAKSANEAASSAAGKITLPEDKKKSGGGGGGGGGGKSKVDQEALKAAKALEAARKAQEAYEFQSKSTGDKIENLRQKQADLGKDTAEYYAIASQIDQLEAQRSRETEAGAKAQERLAEAQWQNAYATADSATQLQMLKDKRTSLTSADEEYYRLGTQITQMERQQAKDSESKSKTKAKGGGGGGGPSLRAPGGGGGGGDGPFQPILDGANQVSQAINAPVALITGNIEKVRFAALQARTGIMGIGGGFSGLITFVPQVIQNVLMSFGRFGGIIDIISNAMMGGLNIIAPYIPLFITNMGALTAGVIGAIGAAAPGIITALGAWIMAMLGWIATNFPSWVTAFGAALMQIAGAILAALPGIVTALGSWAAQFVAWVTLAVPPMILALMQLIVNLGIWAMGQVPFIMGLLGQWALQFALWVIPAAVKLIAALGGMMGQFWLWGATQVPTLMAMLATWGDQFGPWVTDVALPLLMTSLGQMWADFSTWIGTIVTNLSSDGSIGQALADGIAKGITGAWEGLKSMVAGKAQELLASAKSALGIKSPSAKAEAEIGAMYAAGVQRGVVKNWPGVIDAVRSGTSAMLTQLLGMPSMNEGAFAGGSARGLSGSSGGIGSITINTGPVSSDVDVKKMALQIAREIKRNQRP